MALYFTFYLECYREEDATRIAEHLKAWETPFQIAGRTVTNAQVGIESKNGFWYVLANPQGPGYSEYGYGEGMNAPVAITAISESLYQTIASEPGIRRGMAGYEAQDSFDEGDGSFNRTSTHLPDLIYDRQLGKGREDTREWGLCYYRNPPGQQSNPLLINRNFEG